MRKIFVSRWFKSVEIVALVSLLGFLVFDQLGGTAFGDLLWKFILWSYFVENIIRSVSELVKPND